MADVDCSAVLHMAMSVGIDACAGARAAIRAAEIQAKATRHAGSLTLLAGVLALTAAVIAARMQVTIDWARESARSAKFYSKLRKQMLSINYELDTINVLFSSYINNSAETMSQIERKLIDFKSIVDEFKSFIAQDSNPLSGKNLEKYESVVDQLMSSITRIERRLLHLNNPQIFRDTPHEEMSISSTMEETINKTSAEIGRILYGRFYRARRDV